VRAGAFPLPGILGHEDAGIVEEAGSAVTSLSPTDRVVMTFDSCGKCMNCRTGHGGVQCDHWFGPELQDPSNRLLRWIYE
jgi:aryl-alcohol dehydrogenase